LPAKISAPGIDEPDPPPSPASRLLQICARRKFQRLFGSPIGARLPAKHPPRGIDEPDPPPSPASRLLQICARRTFQRLPGSTVGAACWRKRWVRQRCRCRNTAFPKNAEGPLSRFSKDVSKGGRCGKRRRAGTSATARVRAAKGASDQLRRSLLISSSSLCGTDVVGSSAGLNSPLSPRAAMRPLSFSITVSMSC
jgi:hypothetical protein